MVDIILPQFCGIAIIKKNGGNKVMLIRYIHSLLQVLIDREDAKFRNNRLAERHRLNGGYSKGGH